ncbi:uncharacterized protein GLRG_11763 [Colletotrichum graminicola M1.001]|uniref:Uncharacterized protein n=1 Tax=Colletotrichum graminicola (strain M1.001 / M2 / FGSC 10212) TaxID=645133 RepID=E3R0I0_COLGM|nr:uncharacterized protein GLRG_11763 [Colletotrichum graminicola M1.001]EFQ36618.1 hypothetical protein GLRG_11763 [Colletotrichum graminicola M1.001]
MPRQLPDNRVGVLMTAALSGDLALLSRLAGYVPHALRPLDTAQALSAAFYVPGSCPIHDNDDWEDRRPFATLLHVAAMRGDQDMTRWLLGRRVSIEASALLGCLCPSPYMNAICVTGVWSGWGIEPTPLHLSLVYGNKSTAKLLIRKGAVWDRPHTSCGGLTGLHMMAAGRMTEMIEWTIDQCHGPWAGVVARNGPVHDWPDEFGYWSLHYACLSERPKEEDESWAAQMVSGLIRLGALVHTTDGSRIAKRVSEERKRIQEGPRPRWTIDNQAAFDWAQRIQDWEEDGVVLESELALFAADCMQWGLAEAVAAVSKEDT